MKKNKYTNYILLMLQEFKDVFKPPINFTDIDKKYSKKVKMSKIYKILIFASLRSTFIILMGVIISYKEQLNYNIFEGYINLFLILSLIYYSIKLTIKPISSDKVITELSEGKYILVVSNAIALLVFISIDSILIPEYVFLLIFLSIFRSITVRTNYYNGDSIIQKYKYLEKLNIYKRFYAHRIFWLSLSNDEFFSKFQDFTGVKGNVLNESFKHYDDDYILNGYSLFNDNISNYRLYKLYSTLNAKIIDLSSKDLISFNEYNTDDKKQTLIFINGSYLNMSEFKEKITCEDTNRHYIYVNGRSKRRFI